MNKIGDVPTLPKKCQHPHHDFPLALAREAGPGIYEHFCPACNNRLVHTEHDPAWLAEQNKIARAAQQARDDEEREYRKNNPYSYPWQ